MSRRNDRTPAGAAHRRGRPLVVGAATPRNFTNAAMNSSRTAGLFQKKKMSTDEQDDVLPVGRPRLLIYGVLFLAQHGLFDFIRAYTYLQCLSFLAEHGLFGVYFTA